MTNAEKYREEIENYKGSSFCHNFIQPMILKKDECDGACYRCFMLQMTWLLDEYKEPEVDWSEVAIDTPILVRDCETDTWINEYFSEYINDTVFAWVDGRTSWTSNGVAKGWEYAKLAEKEGAI